MQTAIGILIIIAGIVCPFFLMKKAEHRAVAMPQGEPIHPIPIEDAVKSLQQKLRNNPGARVHVELYGHARTDRPVKAPISERPAACYRTISYSCREKDEQKRGKLFHLSTNLEQTEAYRETGPDDFYIMDSTSDEKIYVDMDSFRENAEMLSACDSYEEKGSRWLKTDLENCRRFFPHTGNKITGYHIQEYYYHVNQPLNVVGDLYRHAKRYHIAASAEGKRSLVTYKSEERTAMVLQKARMSALGLGLILVVVGIGVIIAGFR